MDTKKHTEYGSSPTEQAITRFDSCPCFDGRKYEGSVYSEIGALT